MQQARQTPKTPPVAFLLAQREAPLRAPLIHGIHGCSRAAAPLRHTRFPSSQQPQPSQPRAAGPAPCRCLRSAGWWCPGSQPCPDLARQALTTPTPSSPSPRPYFDRRHSGGWEQAVCSARAALPRSGGTPTVLPSTASGFRSLGGWVRPGAPRRRRRRRRCGPDCSSGAGTASRQGPRSAGPGRARAVLVPRSPRPGTAGSACATAAAAAARRAETVSGSTSAWPRGAGPAVSGAGEAPGRRSRRRPSHLRRSFAA